MDFRCVSMTAEMIDPGTGEPVRATVEVRSDPLTGHSSRILPDRGLMPASDFDLAEFAEQTRPGCPFCPDRVGGLTRQLLADNLAAQVAYAQAVMAADPRSEWASINANHMLPSGSSLFHPHMQGIVDPQPTTMQRLLADVPPERFDAYLDAERRAGERWLGDTGNVQWVASYAPIAPAELRAFVPGICSPAQLTGELTDELAHGLALALAGYAELGFESFNFALYGAPPGTTGYPLNLRLACRSNLKPFYRSDSTFLERLHWEGAVDLAPENAARLLRDRFRAC